MDEARYKLFLKVVRAEKCDIFMILPEAFRVEVKSYVAYVREWFISPTVKNRENKDAARGGIIRQYMEVPLEVRGGCLYYLLKSLAGISGHDGLKRLCLALAMELVAELEEMK